LKERKIRAIVIRNANRRAGMSHRVRCAGAVLLGTWLLASTVVALEITRVPYLQNVAQTSVVVMWEECS